MTSGESTTHPTIITGKIRGSHAGSLTRNEPGLDQDGKETSQSKDLDFRQGGEDPHADSAGEEATRKGLAEDGSEKDRDKC